MTKKLISLFSAFTMAMTATAVPVSAKNANVFENDMISTKAVTSADTTALKGTFNIKIDTYDYTPNAYPENAYNLECELYIIQTGKVIAKWNTNEISPLLAENLEYSFDSENSSGNISYAVRILNMPKDCVIHENQGNDSIEICGLDFDEFRDGTNLTFRIGIENTKYVRPVKDTSTTENPTCADIVTSYAVTSLNSVTTTVPSYLGTKTTLLTGTNTVVTTGTTAYKTYEIENYKVKVFDSITSEPLKGAVIKLGEYKSNGYDVSSRDLELVRIIEEWTETDGSVHTLKPFTQNEEYVYRLTAENLSDEYVSEYTDIQETHCYPIYESDEYKPFAVTKLRGDFEWKFRIEEKHGEVIDFSKYDFKIKVEGARYDNNGNVVTFGPCISDKVSADGTVSVMVPYSFDDNFYSDAVYHAEMINIPDEYDSVWTLSSFYVGPDNLSGYQREYTTFSISDNTAYPVVTDIQQSSIVTNEINTTGTTEAHTGTVKPYTTTTAFHTSTAVPFVTTTIHADYAPKVQYDSSVMYKGETREVKAVNPFDDTKKITTVTEISDNIEVTWEGNVINVKAINSGAAKFYVMVGGCAFGRYVTFDIADKHEEGTTADTDGNSTKGDANCDGNVNMADAVIIMQSLANPNKYGIYGTDETHITAQGEKNGDMDGNGLTNADALEIQKKILKIDTDRIDDTPSFLIQTSTFNTLEEFEKNEKNIKYYYIPSVNSDEYKLSKVTKRDNEYVMTEYRMVNPVVADGLSEYDTERLQTLICRYSLNPNGAELLNNSFIENGYTAVECDGKTYYRLDEHAENNPDKQITGYETAFLQDGQLIYMHIPAVDTFENMIAFAELQKIEIK